MGDEMEAVAAVLEAESNVLKDLSDEAKQLTDPVALEQNRLKRQAHVRLFQRVNEELAKRLS